MTISWDTYYVLGYYKEDRAYLSSWNGDAPVVSAVVTGADIPPMWDSAVPAGAELHAVPDGTTADELATKLGGIKVIGWTDMRVVRRAAGDRR